MSKHCRYHRNYDHTTEGFHLCTPIPTKGEISSQGTEKQYTRHGREGSCRFDDDQHPSKKKKGVKVLYIGLGRKARVLEGTIDRDVAPGRSSIP